MRAEKQEFRDPGRKAGGDGSGAGGSLVESAKFAALLDEARQIKGVSLWRDAWRRLRKNRVAIGSLGFLILMGLAALLTPALPLQSPLLQDLDDRQFLRPTFLEHVELDLTERLQVFHAEVDQLRARVAAASGAERRELLQDVADKIQYEHPYDVLWHNPGTFTRALINVRVALFGDWCIPSLCGTDELGRDVLARLLWGGRVSLMVGVVATLVSLIIGVTYGAIAGYLGGWVDTIMMRLVDVWYSIPFIFVVIFLVTILGEEQIKQQLMRYGINEIAIFYLTIGAIYWLTMARVVRGQIISLRHEQFVDAARTIGASSARIIFRHLVPNIMGIVIVYLTLTIPAVMLFEAFLSFLGMGVSPPDVSWGLLVNEGIQVITPIRTRWWLVLFPGLTLALTLFALNFLGDGLRDALDPRLKNA